MIRPEELRIGNYVKYNTMILSVIGINHPVPCEDKRYRDKWVIDLLCDGIITATIDEIEFITLTEEWLLKFGFKNDEPYSILTVNGFEFSWYQYKPGKFLLNDIDVDIRYVHQLQNLYFALTGSELIKTP